MTANQSERWRRGLCGGIVSAFGVMGREIESHLGICRVVDLQKCLLAGQCHNSVWYSSWFLDGLDLDSQGDKIG
jgi:hypothetical protein